MDPLHPEQLHQELEGTIAFIDISGFTKLSERLARLGKAGAEELTATIDTCFVTLLDLAVANGGRLLKFGGDALLVYFSGPAHQARACNAAIAMRRALRVVGGSPCWGRRCRFACPSESTAACSISSWSGNPIASSSSPGPVPALSWRWKAPLKRGRS